VASNKISCLHFFHIGTIASHYLVVSIERINTDIHIDIVRQFSDLIINRFCGLYIDNEWGIVRNIHCKFHM
jgi:hypothetical protein